MSRLHPAETIQVHIRRLVIDAGALDALPPEALNAQVRAAIMQRLGGRATRARLAPVATRIGEAVAPTITRSLGGRDG